MKLLYKIDGSDPQVTGNILDIDPNSGTKGQDVVTLFRSTNGGKGWDVAGWYFRDRVLGEFNSVAWIEDVALVLRPLMDRLIEAASNA